MPLTGMLQVFGLRLMAKAALVTGAHGIMVEVHPEPEKALSDGPQSLTLPGFERLMEEIGKIKVFLGHS